MKGSSEIEVAVDGYIVNKNDEINLYYVIPSFFSLIREKRPFMVSQCEFMRGCL